MKLTKTLKIGFRRRKVFFQLSIFRAYVRFLGVNIPCKFCLHRVAITYLWRTIHPVSPHAPKDGIDPEPGQPGLRLRDTLVEVNGTSLMELTDEDRSNGSMMQSLGYSFDGAQYAKL